jgi:TolB-like protein
MSERKKHKIAVIEFSDLDGRVTELGKFLSEELITRLYNSGRFKVVERQLLKKVLNEHELSAKGIVDEATAKQLGKILGVEVICSGTITDFVNSIKINARLISTETGQIIAVAAKQIVKDETINRLMGYKIPAKTDTKRKFNQNEDIFFKEDFAGYEVGDIVTNWGYNVMVKKLETREKYIENAVGDQVLTHSIDFPKNFTFSFDMWGRTDYLGETLTLIDKNGEELIIFIKTQNYSDYIYLNGISSNDLAPGMGNISKYNGWNTFKLIAKDNVFKTYLNGVFAVSGKFDKYSQFVRIRLTMRKNRRYKNFIGHTIYQ